MRIDRGMVLSLSLSLVSMLGACGGADAGRPAPVAPTPSASHAGQRPPTSDTSEVCAPTATVARTVFRGAMDQPEPGTVETVMQGLLADAQPEPTTVATSFPDDEDYSMSEWTWDNAPPALDRAEWERVGGNQHGPRWRADAVHYFFDAAGHVHHVLAWVSTPMETAIFRYDYARACGAQASAAPDCCCESRGGRALTTTAQCGDQAGECLFVSNCLTQGNEDQYENASR